MREILFRGKDDESGKFVYGYNGLEQDMRGSLPFVLKPSISWEEDKILFSSFVVPETIGQYTGLTDKNGKKIFEGDIVKCYAGASCNGFREHNATIIVDYEDYISIMEISECEESKIIGNIYDNPELLKEREQG